MTTRRRPAVPGRVAAEALVTVAGSSWIASATVNWDTMAIGTRPAGLGTGLSEVTVTVEDTAPAVPDTMVILRTRWPTVPVTDWDADYDHIVHVPARPGRGAATVRAVLVGGRCPPTSELSVNGIVVSPRDDFSVAGVEAACGRPLNTVLGMLVSPALALYLGT